MVEKNDGNNDFGYAYRARKIEVKVIYCLYVKKYTQCLNDHVTLNLLVFMSSDVSKNCFKVKIKSLASYQYKID